MLSPHEVHRVWDAVATTCRRAAVGMLVLTAITSVSSAQVRSPEALTGRGQVGGYLQFSDPRGDFGENTGTGYGLGALGVFQMDPAGILNIRVDGNFLTYGQSTRRIPLSNTGGLIRLDMTTTSSIATLVAGPQLFGSSGPISPYVSGLGGFSVFWTESSVEGSNNDNQPFASTTNSSDFVWAYGGAGGLTIRVANGTRPVRLDIGARYLRHDDAKYLSNDRVKQAFESNQEPVPIRGRADFVSYSLGVSAVVF